MSSRGPQIFRAAIAFEIFANLASLPALFYDPNAALSYMVEDPSNITQRQRQAAMWLGVIVVAVTIPLAMSYPNPAPGDAGNDQRVHRFATYVTLGSSEIVIAAFSLLLLFYKIETGFTDVALQGVFATMLAFVGMRAFFLVVKPGWMEVKDDEKKRQ